MEKKGDFGAIFFYFHGQRSVTAAWATPSHWSIKLCYQHSLDNTRLNEFTFTKKLVNLKTTKNYYFYVTIFCWRRTLTFNIFSQRIQCQQAAQELRRNWCEVPQVSCTTYLGGKWEENQKGPVQTSGGCAFGCQYYTQWCCTFPWRGRCFQDQIQLHWRGEMIMIAHNCGGEGAVQSGSLCDHNRDCT